MDFPNELLTPKATVPITLMGGVFTFLSLALFASMQNGGTEADSVTIAVTSIFLLVGLGAMVSGVYLMRQTAKRRHSAALHRDKPWMQREQWAAGRIKNDEAGNALRMAAFALVWNMISWTVLGFALSDEKFGEDKMVLVVLLFPLAGVGLAIAAGYKLLRCYKYGRSVFEMAQVPGVIGGSLGGIVLARAGLKPAKGFRTCLRCIHSRLRGHGKQRRIEKNVLWEREQHRVQGLTSHPRATAVPVLFTVPYDCPPTQKISTEEEYYWELAVSAEMSGVDYQATFRVPVFKTADSRASVSAALNDLPEDEKAVMELDLASVDGVRVGQTLSGVERLQSCVPQAAYVGFAMLLVAGLVIMAVATLLWLSSAPLVFALFLGFFALAVSLPSLLALTQSVSLLLYPERIEIQRRRFGVPMSPQIVRREQIERVEVLQYMRLGTTPFHRIYIHLRGAKVIRLPFCIPGRLQADVVSNYIEHGRDLA